MPYDKLILKEILLQNDCRTLDVNGRILPPSNLVYHLIANRMALRGSHIEPRHVYTIVNEDRNGFKTLIATVHKIDPEGNKTHNISNSTVFDISSSIDSSCNLSESVHIKKLKLVLSAQKWLEISPKKKISGSRIYWKLQEGWADVIAERICQQHGSVDCVFSFKNNLVTPSATAETYAKFHGYCTECQAKITGRLQNAPTRDTDVIFSCRIENIQSQYHTGRKKRQLRGERRVKVANQLIEQRKDAITFLRDEAKRMKKFGGKNLPIIPNVATLRKAKEQQLLKQLGLEFANPPINLLHQSKYGKYAGSIHSIGLLKFHCMYWSPEQQQIYTARCRKNPSAVLTIDATGSIAKRATKHSPNVFLYQCMIVTKEGSVPVFQMVSADQRSFLIAHFLRLILTKGVPRPPAVVCDFGRALVNAVAEIFGKCNNMRDYLQKCYDAIVRGFPMIPASYIRLDVSHFIAMVSRWKCFDKRLPAVRQFYIRCISQAYQMQDFEALTYLLESVLAVSLSESIGNTSDGVPVPAEIRIQALNKIIQGIPLKEIEFSNEEAKENEISESSNAEDDAIDTDWQMWANTIYSNAEDIGKKSKDGTIINACFNSDFARCLKKELIPYLPLWTGIMRCYFEESSIIATSSSVESEFADMKHRAFNVKLPMRIDKFVFQHLDYLDGKVKLASNERDIQTEITDKNMSKLDTQVLESEFNFAASKSKTSDESYEDMENNDNGINIHDDDKSFPIDHGGLKSTDTEIEFTQHSNAIDIWDNNNKIPLTGYEQLKLTESSDKEVSNFINKETDAENSLSNPFMHDEEIQSSPTNDCNIWNTCEDWGGKAEKELKRMDVEKESSVKKRPKPSYLDTCPEWEYIKDTKISKLPVFKNGLFCEPVNMGQFKLNVKNTCAFDSLFQVIMSAMASNRMYCEILEKSDNHMIQLALKILKGKHKLTVADYRERATILSKIGLFKMESITRTIRRIDSECNVTHLAEYILHDIPSHKTKVLCQCGYNFATQNITFSINVDLLLCQGFSFMQHAIDGCKTKRTCRKCGTLIEDEIEYGPHVIIDTSIVTDDKYTTRNKDLHHTLNSITKIVEINNRIYSLAGVVSWSPGHYIGYAKSGMYWHEYNDVGPTRESVNPNKIIQPHLIMYTFSGEK